MLVCVAPKLLDLSTEDLAEGHIEFACLAWLVLVLLHNLRHKLLINLRVTNLILFFCHLRIALQDISSSCLKLISKLLEVGVDRQKLIRYFLIAQFFIRQQLILLSVFIFSIRPVDHHQLSQLASLKFSQQLFSIAFIRVAQHSEYFFHPNSFLVKLG